MAEIVTGAGATPDVDATAVSPARIFWATWFGWMLDGFDSSMYSYILVGALSELLPASGIRRSMPCSPPWKRALARRQKEPTKSWRRALIVDPCTAYRLP